MHKLYQGTPQIYLLGIESAAPWVFDRSSDVWPFQLCVSSTTLSTVDSVQGLLLHVCISFQSVMNLQKLSGLKQKCACMLSCV